MLIRYNVTFKETGQDVRRCYLYYKKKKTPRKSYRYS